MSSLLTFTHRNFRESVCPWLSLLQRVCSRQSPRTDFAANAGEVQLQTSLRLPVDDTILRLKTLRRMRLSGLQYAEIPALAPLSACTFLSLDFERYRFQHGSDHRLQPPCCLDYRVNAPNTLEQDTPPAGSMR